MLFWAILVLSRRYLKSVIVDCFFNATDVEKKNKRVLLNLITITDVFSYAKHPTWGIVNLSLCWGSGVSEKKRSSSFLNSWYCVDVELSTFTSALIPKGLKDS